MTWCLMHCNGPLRKYDKSPCKLMVGLSGNKLSQIWKRLRTLPSKILLMALDPLEKKGGGQRSHCDPEYLKRSCGRFGFRWTLFLGLPLVCVGSLGVLYFETFFQLTFQIVPKKKKTMNMISILAQKIMRKVATCLNPLRTGGVLGWLLFSWLALVASSIFFY